MNKLKEIQKFVNNLSREDFDLVFKEMNKKRMDYSKDDARDMIQNMTEDLKEEIRELGNESRPKASIMCRKEFNCNLHTAKLIVDILTGR